MARHFELMSGLDGNEHVLRIRVFLTGDRMYGFILIVSRLYEFNTVEQVQSYSLTYIRRLTPADRNLQVETDFSLFFDNLPETEKVKGIS